MLSRLNLLSNHLTGLPQPENLLDKYRKMSKLDCELLDEIYFLGNKDTVKMYENVIYTERSFT
jgi:hypothetical protein